MKPFPLMTELHIEGFKSFGTPAQRLHLGPLQFVVGANASGKTNLMTALRFVQQAVVRDVQFAVHEFGGMTEVGNKMLREKKKLRSESPDHRSSPSPLAIGFKLDVSQGNLAIPKPPGFRILEFTYFFQLDGCSESGPPLVELEELTADIESKSGEKLKYHFKRTQHEIEISDPTTEAQEHKMDVPLLEASRLALGIGFFSFPPVLLRRLIEDWRFYHIHPEIARTPSKETPDVDLGPAGENLAVVLHQLEQQNDKAALNAIIAGLSSAIPGFRGVKTRKLPIEGKWAFQLLEEKIRGAIHPGSVSDGTIRLLALLVITNWTAKASSLCVLEEPENSIHPHLSEHIVQLLRTASEERQLIVTTHNPAFLDHLLPEEVILCDKVDGFTRLHAASDIAHIQTFRKHFRLGELWVQGALGGIP